MSQPVQHSLLFIIKFYLMHKTHCLSLKISTKICEICWVPRVLFFKIHFCIFTFIIHDGPIRMYFWTKTDHFFQCAFCSVVLTSALYICRVCYWSLIFGGIPQVQRVTACHVSFLILRVHVSQSQYDKNLSLSWWDMCMLSCLVCWIGWP